MILCSFNNFKFIDQKSYHLFLSGIDLGSLVCPKCGQRHLIGYGYYTRSFITASTTVQLDIQRVFCKHCHSTHALLPTFLVPYSRFPVHVLSDIIINDPERMMILYQISMKAVRRIRSMFHQVWSRLLPSGWRSLSTTEITAFCCSRFERQFMQVRFLFVSIYTPT